MEEILTMSMEELDKLKVVQEIQKKRITQIEGAKLLGISTRQLRRDYASYKKHGARGLVSKKRGKPSNRRIPDKVRESVLQAIQADYPDFGPTLAHEKLTDLEGKYQFKIGIESVRKIMIQAGLRRVRRRKEINHHQMRPRRSAFGELIQIDGSPHDWFEGRAESCCLLVAVIDGNKTQASLQLPELCSLSERRTKQVRSVAFILAPALKASLTPSILPFSAASISKTIYPSPSKKLDSRIVFFLR